MIYPGYAVVNECHIDSYIDYLKMTYDMYYHPRRESRDFCYKILDTLVFIAQSNLPQKEVLLNDIYQKQLEKNRTMELFEWLFDIENLESYCDDWFVSSELEDTFHSSDEPNFISFSRLPDPSAVPPGLERIFDGGSEVLFNISDGSLIVMKGDLLAKGTVMPFHDRYVACCLGGIDASKVDCYWDSDLPYE